MKQIILILLLLEATTYEAAPPSSEQPVVTKPGIQDYATSFDLTAESFTEMVKSNHIFIDNSALIAEVFGPLSQFYILGPRKSGKTINLDMLKTFFEIQVDDRGRRIMPKNATTNYRLFVHGEITADDGTIEKLRKPLSISKRKDLVDAHLGEYPVVYISFKDVKGDSYGEIERTMGLAVVRAYQQHEYMIKVFQRAIAKRKRFDSTMDEEDLKLFNETLNFENMKIDYLQHDVLHLCRMLTRYHNQYPIIIYDDFDKPLTNILHSQNLAKKYARRIVAKLEDILISTTHTNRDVYMTFVVATLEVYRFHPSWVEDSRIDLVLDHDQTIARHFVFDQNITDYLLNLYKLPRKSFYEVDKWYKGFQTDHFNIYSIVKYLNYNKTGKYFDDNDIEHIAVPLLRVNSRIREQILTLLSKTSLSQNYKRMQAVIDAETIFKLIPHTANTSDLVETADAFQLFLIRKGYLSIHHEQIDEELDENTDQEKYIECSIPNREVATSMCSWLISYYQTAYDIVDDNLRSTAAMLLRFVNNEPLIMGPLERYLTQIYNRSSPHIERRRQLNITENGDGIEHPFHAVLSCVVLEMQKQSEFNVDVFHPKFVRYDGPDHTLRGSFSDSNYVIANYYSGQAIVLQLNNDRDLSVIFTSMKKSKSTVLKELNQLYTVRLVVVQIYDDNKVELYARSDG